MDVNDAVALIRNAVAPSKGAAVWADLGAGTGTFTRALARILDAGSTIYAVDQDAKSIAALRQCSRRRPADAQLARATR